MRFNLLCLSLLFSSVASAGGGSTTGRDGGHGVFCNKRTYLPSSRYGHREYRLVVLDLYEAHTLYGARRSEKPGKLVFDSSRAEVQHQVCNILSARYYQLKNVSSKVGLLSQAFKDACKMKFRVGEISSTADHGPIEKLPKECQIVQIGVSQESESGKEIILSGEYMPWLTIEHLAALSLHETLHTYFQKGSSTLAVRQMVILTFAKSSFVERNQAALEDLLETRRAVELQKLR